MKNMFRTASLLALGCLLFVTILAFLDGNKGGDATKNHHLSRRTKLFENLPRPLEKLDLDTEPTEVIHCPFLRMIDPSTKNLLVFLGLLVSNGLGPIAANTVTFTVLTQQKGYLAWLLMRAPDVHRLDQVPGVSHDDRYLPFPDDTSRMLQERRTAEGTVTLQDLADIKMFIATQRVNMNVDDIIVSSKIETVLAFLAAGGDYHSMTCQADVVEAFLLNGTRPSHFYISQRMVRRGISMVDWELN